MIEEPTGDPTACELGDHLDVEGGICLLCGEWVFDYAAAADAARDLETDR